MHDYHQLLIKVETMQKIIERYEIKINEMQKHLDLLTLTTDTQRDQNERLNNDLTDLTDLHQVEMSSMRTDLRKLEEKLLYNVNEYWNEMVEKLEKLDTRVRSHCSSRTNARSFSSRQPKSNRHKHIRSKPKRIRIVLSPNWSILF
jgi:predicted  nucleic acid-binding Zn-ribbon protein